MTFPSFEPATMGIGTVAGLAIGKMADFFIRRQMLRDKSALTEAAAIRQELREEVKVLRTKMDKQDDEIRTWREKFFDINAKYQDLLVEFHAFKLKMESESAKVPAMLNS